LTNYDLDGNRGEKDEIKDQNIREFLFGTLALDQYKNDQTEIQILALSIDTDQVILIIEVNNRSETKKIVKHE